MTLHQQFRTWLWLLVTGMLLCGASVSHGADQIREKLLEARKLAGQTYYDVSPAWPRRFSVGKDGMIQEGLPMNVKLVWAGENGTSSSPHSPHDVQRALQQYRKLQNALLGAPLEKENAASPDLIVDDLNTTPLPTSLFGSARAIKKALEKNPSSLLAIVYLELALLEKKLGNADVYDGIVAEAVEKLCLTEIDFRADVEFRRHIEESANFDRPEVVLLFNAAELAREKGKLEKAQEYYRVIIERCPGSPSAWDALAVLTMLKSDQKELEKLTEHLLETWPLIWGAPRHTLCIDKEAFAKQLPSLLKKVGESYVK